MNKTFKLTALLMVLVLCLSFAACGNKKADEPTTVLPGEDETYAADTTTALPDNEPTVAPVIDEVTGQTENVTGATEDTSAAEESSAPQGAIAQPATKQEIVELFNTSANAVRTDKPGYSCAVTNYVNNIDCKGNGALQKIADIALKYIDASPTSNTVAKGASHKDFGCSSPSYASALAVTSVSNATCVKSGNSYKIKITLNKETLNDLPKDPLKTNTGKGMLVLNANEVYEQTDKIPGITITKFAPTYTGCYIECTINATTGKMTSCTYFWHSLNDVGAKVVGMNVGAIVDFGIKRAYTLKY